MAKQEVFGATSEKSPDILPFVESPSVDPIAVGSMHLQKRVLVTGGSGFLGSHLCERLLDQGANVICLDNFFTGARTNIEHLLDNKHFELIRHDVTFPIYLEIDQIYNLACPASPIHYQHDPVQTTKTSVHGAINMLGLAKRLKCRILQASTSEVYGDPEVHPQTEEYWGHVNPIGPRSCYDEGKRVAESLCMSYYHAHKLEVRDRRSRGASPDRRVLGARQPHRAAKLLRRREARRRVAVHELLPRTQARGPRSAIPRCIPRPKSTGGTSTPSGREAATTKGSASPSRCA